MAITTAMWSHCGSYPVDMIRLFLTSIAPTLRFIQLERIAANDAKVFHRIGKQSLWKYL